MLVLQILVLVLWTVAAVSTREWGRAQKTLLGISREALNAWVQHWLAGGAPRHWRRDGQAEGTHCEGLRNMKSTFDAEEKMGKAEGKWSRLTKPYENSSCKNFFKMYEQLLGSQKSEGKRRRSEMGKAAWSGAGEQATFQTCSRRNTHHLEMDQSWRLTKNFPIMGTREKKLTQFYAQKPSLVTTERQHGGMANGRRLHTSLPRTKGDKCRFRGVWKVTNVEKRRFVVHPWSTRFWRCICVKFVYSKLL